MRPGRLHREGRRRWRLGAGGRADRSYSPAAALRVGFGGKTSLEGLFPEDKKGEVRKDRDFEVTGLGEVVTGCARWNVASPPALRLHSYLCRDNEGALREV